MLTEEQIISNWEKFSKLISDIGGLRGQTLFVWYTSSNREERFATMPASGNEKFHNAFPGGYIAHVLGVYDNAMSLYDLWTKQGAYTGDFTKEELAFCALNHDLGKFGNDQEEYYIPQTSQWHKDNKGEIYMHNPKLSFMKTSDRSLFILQSLGIPLSENEYLGIKLHDGLYEESNKSYLVSYSDTYRLQSSLAYILHQADLMASRIEYDNVNRINYKENIEVINWKDEMRKTPIGVPVDNNTGKPRAHLNVGLQPGAKNVNDNPGHSERKAKGKYAHLLNHK